MRDGEWWVSTVRFTVLARVADGRIVWASPLVRRFVGQPFGNLIRWCRRIGGLMYTHLDQELSDWKGMDDGRALH